MGSRLTLRDPDPAFVESYRDLVREMRELGEPLVPFPLEFPSDDASEFLQRLEDCARGRDIPEGFVPHSTFWLIRDGREVVGVSNLRHSLTDRLRREGGHIGYGVRPSARGRGYATEMLRLTLERARRRGLSTVLLTCAKSNVPSARTIIRNGGILTSEEFLPERGEVVQRYRIDLE